MTRGRLLAVGLALASTGVLSAQQPRYAGRPLADVLSELSRSGLALVYSSRVVRPELVVIVEPHATLPRRILDEILAPHGLRAETGPKGRLLVVRAVEPKPAPTAPTPDRVATGAIRVSLRARDTGGSIRPASVALTSDDGSAAVLGDGRVLVADLAPGPRFVEAALPGYLPAATRTVAIKAGLTLDVAIDLDRAAGAGARPTPATVTIALTITRGVQYQETVVVSERRYAPAEDMSLTVTPTADLLQGAGHAGNLYSAMQALPGVKSGHEFDSRLVVRGGSPDENLVIVDGVEILAPYHLFGLASTILPSAVESVAWSAGGFDVRYGDRLSSVVSIRTRDGAAVPRMRGSLGAGLFDSDFVAEGPVAGVPGVSWVAAGRYSFYDLTAGALLGFGFPAFNDVHTKLTWTGSTDRRAWLLGALGRERTHYVEHDDPGERWSLRTRNRTRLAAAGVETALGGHAQMRSVVSDYRLADAMGIKGTMATDARASPSVQTPDGRLARVDFDRATDVEDLAVRHELNVTLAGGQTLGAGAELHRLRTRWRWGIAGDRSDGLANRSLPWPYGLPGASLPSALDSRRDDTRTGGFVQYGLLAGRTSTQAGLRVDHSTLTGDVTVSPRASLALRAGEAARVRLSAGLYRQSPGYEKLFLADRFVDLSQARGLHSERAAHAEVAVERDLARGVTARVEAYRKTYSGLVIGRLETEYERRARLTRYDFGAFAADVPAEPQITASPVNGGRGSARGVDLLITKTAAAGDPRLSGWISYSYATAREEAYGLVRPADYDRRHAFGAIAQYRLSPRLAVSGTLRIASGAPWTPPVGLRVAATADRVDADGDANRDEWIPARDTWGRIVYALDLGGWSNVNSAHLPVYARLDARATLTPGGEAGRWTLYVDVVNLLNRNNAGLITCRVSSTGAAVPAIERSPDFSVPFLPSFGFRYRF